MLSVPDLRTRCSALDYHAERLGFLGERVNHLFQIVKLKASKVGQTAEHGSEHIHRCLKLSKWTKLTISSQGHVACEQTWQIFTLRQLLIFTDPSQSIQGVNVQNAARTSQDQFLAQAW
jgi:hypothetical protein